MTTIHRPSCSRRFIFLRFVFFCFRQILGLFFHIFFCAFKIGSQTCLCPKQNLCVLLINKRKKRRESNALEWFGTSLVRFAEITHRSPATIKFSLRFFSSSFLHYQFASFSCSFVGCPLHKSDINKTSKTFSIRTNFQSKRCFSPHMFCLVDIRNALVLSS